MILTHNIDWHTIFIDTIFIDTHTLLTQTLLTHDTDVSFLVKKFHFQHEKIRLYWSGTPFARMHIHL